MPNVTLVCSTCGARARRALTSWDGPYRGVHEAPCEPARCPRGHGPMVRLDGREVGSAPTASVDLTWETLNRAWLDDPEGELAQAMSSHEHYLQMMSDFQLISLSVDEYAALVHEMSERTGVKGPFDPAVIVSRCQALTLMLSRIAARAGASRNDLRNASFSAPHFQDFTAASRLPHVAILAEMGEKLIEMLTLLAQRSPGLSTALRANCKRVVQLSTTLTSWVGVNLWNEYGTPIQKHYPCIRCGEDEIGSIEDNAWCHRCQWGGSLIAQRREYEQLAQQLVGRPGDAGCNECVRLRHLCPPCAHLTSTETYRKEFQDEES